MIEINDLHVNVEGKPILKGFSLKVLPGECHALMGPNGAGKSTLAKVLAGHPHYEVTAGSVFFQNQNILEMEPEDRAALGLFMSFQYPLEIPGVTNLEFLHAAHSAKCKARSQKPLIEESFEIFLDEKMKKMSIPAAFKTRYLNEGFSGGEKKRNEILQMAVMDPLFSILDETDSGLDIDAMRIVAKGINELHTSEKGLILITHYQRLLDFIQPDFIHVMIDGKIVKSGSSDLGHELEEKGYALFEGV